jgi:hypothetical protein
VKEKTAAPTMKERRDRRSCLPKRELPNGSGKGRGRDSKSANAGQSPKAGRNLRVLWNIDRTGPNLVASLSVSVKFAVTSCFFSNRMTFRRSAQLLVHKRHQHPRPGGYCLRMWILSDCSETSKRTNCNECNNDTHRALFTVFSHATGTAEPNAGSQLWKQSAVGNRASRSAR